MLAFFFFLCYYQAKELKGNIITMFEQMKERKEADILCQLLLDKATYYEPAVGLTCVTYLFPTRQTKNLSYNQYTIIDCLLFMERLYKNQLRCISRANDFLDNPVKGISDRIYDLQFHIKKCVSLTICDYLKTSDEEYDLIRASRSRCYLSMERELPFPRDFEDYIKTDTEVFSYLITNDITSSNPKDVSFDNGMPIIDFNKYFNLSIEVNAFCSYLVPVIKKTIKPEFQEDGLL